MVRFIIRRILLLVPVIIGATFLVYFIIDLAPGDIVFALGGDGLTEAEMALLRHELGLDRPLIIRYLDYIRGLFTGDLGYSLLTGRSVVELYFQRLPMTLRLAGSATLVSVLIAIPLGIYSAVRKGSVQDNIAMTVSMLGVSMPNFWIGLLLIIGFSLHLGLFPSGGYNGIRYLVLPALTIGTGLAANLTRMTRSSMIDALGQDYLRTVRAKGVSEKKVIRRHALKNALIPIITIIGTQFSISLGGSILTESVFAMPGVGRLVMDAIRDRDFAIILGSVVLTTILTGIILLIVDLLYAFVDPRIKAQYMRRGKTT